MNYSNIHLFSIPTIQIAESTIRFSPILMYIPFLSIKQISCKMLFVFINNIETFHILFLVCGVHVWSIQIFPTPSTELQTVFHLERSLTTRKQWSTMPKMASFSATSTTCSWDGSRGTQTGKPLRLSWKRSSLCCLDQSSLLLEERWISLWW